MSWFLRARTLGFALALCVAGCAGSSDVICKRDPITGSEMCQSVSDSYGEAAVGAGAAAVTWGVVGCTVNGCVPPYVCNGKTKMCELVHCSETTRCPAGTVCNVSEGVCR
jgi:hypothetical protein